MLLHFLVIYTEHAKKGRRCVPFFRSSSLFRRIEIDEASLQNDTALILCQRVHAKFNILDPVPGDMFGRNFCRAFRYIFVDIFNINIVSDLEMHFVRP